MTPLRVATIVLAAGSSTRMGGLFKLLEILRGEHVVTRSVRAALDGGADPVLVVTGHRAADVVAVLPAGVTPIHNPDFRDGLATSLRCGLAALPDHTEAAFVALGDMPLVEARHYAAMIDAWRQGAIVVPVRDGRRGNPVLWSARFFAEMSSLDGDRGAKPVLEEHDEAVIELRVDGDAHFLDIDDRLDLERARGHG